MTELTKLTIESAIAGLKNKQFSAVELTRAHLAEMEKNQDLNAYIVNTPEIALAQAAESDKKIAKLSRIKIKDEEKAHCAKELSSIMAFVEQLSEVNTDGVPEMASVSNVTLPLREDAVTDGGITKKILANAPKSEFDCFIVPKVVDAG